MARQRRTYKRKHERENDIILAAFGQLSRGKKSFTMYTMAKWVGLAASNKLKKMIDGLAAEGWFTRVEKQHRGNVVKHVYSFSPEGLERLEIL